MTRYKYREKGKRRDKLKSLDDCDIAARKVDERSLNPANFSFESKWIENKKGVLPGEVKAGVVIFYRRNRGVNTFEIARRL